MQFARLIHSPQQFSLVFNSQLMAKNSRTLPKLLSQVRWFRHNPEDVSKVSGRPERKVIETPKEVPKEAVVTYSPIWKASALKQLAAQYGSVAFSVFIAVSLTNLTVCVVLVKYFGLGAYLMKNATFVGFAQKFQYAEFASEFMVAYVLHKFLAPLRYFLTAITTPVLVKFLRKRGWMKPAPKRE